MNEKYLLALNCHEKIGSQTLKKILAAFPDPEKVWRGSEGELKRKLDEKIVGYILDARKMFIPEKEAEKLIKLNIGYMTIYDSAYPRLLKEIYDAPALLYVRGDASFLGMAGLLAVVGSRKYTPYGQRAAKSLVCGCVKAGLGIVSGLALGIDGIAHRVALENGGITIGVLGCGLDKVYPSSHSMLAHQIIEQGGALISEYPPGMPALKQNFPARNRIIAGLSLGTLVIEAGERSGTLITAYSALEYNREVFAVPGNIDQESSRGTNTLIQKGAKLVLSPEDIFEELPVEIKKCQQQARELLPETEEEKTILDVLSGGEMLVDAIVAKSGLNVIIINSTLSMMEMKGMVENTGGGRYRKV